LTLETQYKYDTSVPDAWSPAQYGQFADERAQPFHDLVALLPAGSIGRAVDLGCGPGELTAGLVRDRDIARCVGIDNSAAMLAAASAHAIGGRLTFADGDIGEWTGDGDGDLDLVLASASMHWLPDHPAVLARWTAALAPGGQLLVQVPANSHHPSHAIARAVADEAPFRSALGGEPPADPVAVNVLAPDRYSSLLYELGYAEHTVRLQVYGHLLPDTAAVVEWMRGTSLTRFERRLEPSVYEAFVERYRRRLIDELGDRRPFFFTFPRILMWGRRPR
jgi:trans-aconitate 2-methyltransferase